MLDFSTDGLSRKRTIVEKNLTMIHRRLPFSAIPRNMPMSLDTNLATGLGRKLMSKDIRQQSGRTLLMLLLMQCAAIPAFAQERSLSGVDAHISMPASFSRSAIDGDVLANARGRLSVNVSAGIANAQSNSAAIAASPASAHAVATANVRVEAVPGVQGHSTALIAGNAFAGAAGMLSVNQASGSANAQANIIAIGVGLEADALAESVLSSTASGIAPASAARGSVREAAISDSAFRGARGLVQVNQSAGSGNRTANHFALQVQTGTRP
jgi:hypothetical protein